ncbi:efflux RND transporter periplasmic adaptor subunit [Chlorobium limicola]|uniref:RND transporter n=1 Tax=Chlorobium limicola TaxID=1092 RepID=A0A117MKA6_CHLLI|nr:efflux RND transporter periplasmic adaptor subunit [Chlorobium limicola]KUL22044.1 RND transporter [Chlorobium limicola]
MIKPKKLPLVFLLLSFGSIVFWWYQQRSRPVEPDYSYQREMPVIAVPAEVSAIRDSIVVTGTAEAFRDVEIFSETGGLVRKAQVEVGDRKAAGAVLYVVDDELQSTSFKKAEASFEKAALDYVRYENLHREGAVALSALESVRLKREEAEADMIAARRNLRNTRIKTPVSGTVTEKVVDEGEMVQPGMRVANVVDLSRLRITFFLSEKEVSNILPGYPVRVTSDQQPGVLLQGRVSSISGKAGKDHTYAAEAVFRNSADVPFRAGMFVRVILSGDTSREALMIPRIALAGSIINPEVYVVRKGVVRLRQIGAGKEYGEMLEILQGVAAGELVVTSGQHELRDGMKVRLVPQKKMESAR